MSLKRFCNVALSDRYRDPARIGFGAEPGRIGRFPTPSTRTGDRRMTHEHDHETVVVDSGGAVNPPAATQEAPASP